MRRRGTVLLLGSIHFDRPDNGDLLHLRGGSMLTPDRQKQIEDVLNVLSDFRPTKVMLETRSENQHDLTLEYAAYRAGNLTLTADERHQLGFRLAAQMNLADLLAIDWNQMVDGVPSLGQLRDEEPERFDEIIAKETERIRQMEHEFSELPLLSFLHKINTDGRTREMHQTYLTLACLGVSGMEWMARYWYVRNLMIFKNILTQSEGPEERIVVIYGLAHVHLLQQLLRESGEVNLLTFDDIMI
ncbi:DUF5694 domain-containing protein [Exiguobacterium artemiae]|uniref:DUF5694 domain-containing protein n=1 Tax=Exiguobacterium artemiae TaxID=340145 RepID=UPI00296405AD|nr:DUF5694 domain-containing protein [Exiguobacterium sibiricum]MDW2886040.1 DUF5694 domain-containing protein [Exiguobacterium sibiricum]